MQGKTAYVGSAKGELSVMVSRQDAIVAVDLLLPNVPPFTLRMNTADIVDKDGDIFYEMLGAVIMQTVEYLKSCNVPANLVEALHQELVKKAEGVSEDDHADRTGTGGSKLLEAIVDLEPLSSYEVPFDMPDGMIEALHQHIVTAGQKGRKRGILAAFHTIKRPKEPTKLPHNFQTNHAPNMVEQQRPSLRDIVRKFKNQQNKKLTGPLFVLVYDMNGRPVGVRSIKGPGWQGIGGKIAAKDVVEINGQELPIFVNPSRTEVRGLQMNYMCRAWLSGDGQTLVAWCGYDGVHGHVRDSYLRNFAWGTTNDRIPLEIWGKLVNVTDSSRNTKWHHSPYLKQLLMASPALRRALGGPPEEITYYDEAIVGPWDELEPEPGHSLLPSGSQPAVASLFRKRAKSFDPADIPNNFWAVLDLGYDLNPEILQQLVDGHLTGIRGISETGAIVAQFTFHSGNAMLRMPGPATVQLNKLSRVGYANVHYLSSKGLGALFRIFNQAADDNGAGNVLANIMGRFTSMDPNLNYYGTAIQNEIRRLPNLYASVSQLHSPQAVARFLAEHINQFFQEKFSEDVPTYTPEQLTPWVQSTLERVGHIYSDEGEWFVKNGELQIPPGSSLVLEMPPLAQKIMDLEADGQDPAQVLWGTSRTSIEEARRKTQVLQEAVKSIQAKGHIRVVLKPWVDQVVKDKAEILRKKRERAASVETTQEHP